MDSHALIKRFTLVPDPYYEHYRRNAYRDFLWLCDVHKNCYATGRESEYGHVVTKFNINGILIEIAKNTKTNYENRFYSNSVNNIDKNTQYVVLDIETTGLDFLADDIAQIGIYESEANKYVRYLPLEKKQTNTAISINHIPDSRLKNKSPLQQKEIDEIIKQFDLKNKIVIIWTGANQFDRVFLELYFREHDLTGLEHFTFFNAKNLLDSMKEKLQVHNFSKDEVARIYGLKNDNSHDALSDCKVEKQIVEKLLAGEIELLIDRAPEMLFYRDFKRFIDGIRDCSADNTYYANSLYQRFIEILKSKNGMVWGDYDKPHRTRGAEWIDIHHIDETELDDIGTRTQQAQITGDQETLEELSPYNKKERLVWANKVEHFILHILIDHIRLVPSGGSHWMFGCILKLRIGVFANGTTEYALQSRMNDFYQFISFDELLKIYIKNAKLTSEMTDLPQMQEFWQLDYNYDESKFKQICDEIDRGLAK